MMQRAMIFMLVLAGASCTSAKDGSIVMWEGNPLSCSVGSICSVSGELEILFSSMSAAGRIHVGGYCYALALPQSVLDKSKEWKNRLVLVSGKVFEDPNIIGSVDLLVADRWVYQHVCPNDGIIYVESISLR